MMKKAKKWGVKYQTHNAPVRTYTRKREAERDAARCRKIARQGGDMQAISVIEIE